MFESKATLRKDGDLVDLFLPLEKWRELLNEIGGSNKLTVILRMDSDL